MTAVLWIATMAGCGLAPSRHVPAIPAEVQQKFEDLRAALPGFPYLDQVLPGKNGEAIHRRVRLDGRTVLFIHEEQRENRGELSRHSYWFDDGRLFAVQWWDSAGDRRPAVREFEMYFDAAGRTTYSRMIGDGEVRPVPRKNAAEMAAVFRIMSKESLENFHRLAADSTAAAKRAH